GTGLAGPYGHGARPGHPGDHTRRTRVVGKAREPAVSGLTDRALRCDHRPAHLRKIVRGQTGSRPSFPPRNFPAKVALTSRGVRAGGPLWGFDSSSFTGICSP